MVSYFLRRHDPDRFNGRRLPQPDLSPCWGTRVDVIEPTEASLAVEIRWRSDGPAAEGRKGAFGTGVLGGAVESIGVERRRLPWRPRC